MQGTNDNRSAPSSLRPGHVRTVALAATIVGVVVLPIAAAQATPSHGDTAKTNVTGTPATGAPATATATLPQYCGSTETGFSGVTAQVCVDNSDGTVTGTVFVNNTSAKPLTAAVNLTRADGSLANMTCTVVAHDANGSCTTGPLDLTAGKGAFDAIAEVVPVNAPVSAGVLRADSGSVAPAAAAGDDSAATPSPSASSSSTDGSGVSLGVSVGVGASGTPSN